jgi:E3 ubiquitin-protein ligase DOA10
MTIDTTANIDVNTYRKIKDTAKMLKISGRKLVHILLKLAVKEKPFRYRQFMAVEYQADLPEECWVCFHLRLSGVVYESSHDMRRLMKYSVSFLLCYAVKVYLDRAVRILTEDENLISYPEIYGIFAFHTAEKSTFTVIHTFPEIKDLPRYITHPEEYT